VKILLWFRRDLRVHDQILIHEANRSENTFLAFAQADLNARFKNTGEKRWGERKKKFYLESILNLKSSLEENGIPLWFSDRPLSNAIEQLEEQFIPDEIWCQQTAGWEEKEEIDFLAKHFKIKVFESQSLYHPDDLPFRLEAIPFGFTDFKKKVEKYASIRECYNSSIEFNGAQNIEAPKLPSPPMLETEEFSAFPFAGGECAGLERLESWIWKGNHLLTYKETRNQLIGTDYSSKFSPYLAWGCLSPRKIYWEIKKYEKKVISNQSTYWLYFELLWRDFFHFVCRNENASFFKYGQNELLSMDMDFLSWAKGIGQNAFINANMIELAKTGFMSNRGRQNVASFLVHNVKKHWALGAQHFESELIDFEPANNYGNWTYLAGIGHDPRKQRIFNPDLQKQRYDAEGKYVELWN